MAREGRLRRGNLLPLVAANLCLLAAGPGSCARGWSLGLAPRGHVVAGRCVHDRHRRCRDCGRLRAHSRTRALTLAVPPCLRASASARPARRPPSAASEGAAVSLEAWPLKAALAVLLGLLVAESTIQALDTWDAFAMWTMKSRALVLFDGLSIRLCSRTRSTRTSTIRSSGRRCRRSTFGRWASSTLAVHAVGATGWVMRLAAFSRAVAPRAGGDVDRLGGPRSRVQMAPATMTLIQQGYADIVAAMFISLAAWPRGSTWRSHGPPGHSWWRCSPRRQRRRSVRHGRSRSACSPLPSSLRCSGDGPLRRPGRSHAARSHGRGVVGPVCSSRCRRQRRGIDSRLSRSAVPRQSFRPCLEAIVGPSPTTSTRPYLWLIVILLGLRRGAGRNA